MSHLPRAIAAACACSALLLAPGCSPGDGLDRQAISGTVTFDGKPLPSGTIQLQPAQDTPGGVASGGEIKDGRFAVARKDGPAPGRYAVMIFANAGNKAGPEPPPAEDQMPGVITAKASPRTGLIPIRYNFKTELAADVKSGGPNDFAFTLEKK